MEINSAKYNKIIEKIEECIGHYERMNFQYNKHVLYLANGDILNIKTLPNNVPHLLGVNLDYLRQANRFKQYMDKYAELKCFVDEKYPFSKLVVEDKKLNYDLMFSNYIDEKLDIFVDNIKIRTDDMQYIVKYDREKTYQIEEEADICDYYIIRKIHGAYCLLGLIQSENGIYVPVTSRKYDSHFAFEDFMERMTKKQEITYPYFMKIRNSGNIENNHDYGSTMNDKQIFLDKTTKAAEKYGATASVARDYGHSLNIFISDKNKTNNNIILLKLLSDSILNNDVLDKNTIDEICGENEVPEDLINLINTCNNKICSSPGIINASYSEVCSERDKLKQELEQAKLLIEQQTTDYNDLKEQNQQLINENNIYKDQIDIVEEAYQKIKSIKKQ